MQVQVSSILMLTVSVVQTNAVKNVAQFNAPFPSQICQDSDIFRQDEIKESSLRSRGRGRGFGRGRDFSARSLGRGRGREAETIILPKGYICYRCGQQVSNIATTLKKDGREHRRRKDVEFAISRVKNRP
jgi:hypothetical protein